MSMGNTAGGIYRGPLCKGYVATVSF